MQGATNLERIIAQNGHLQPYLLVVDQLDETYLIVDNQVINGDVCSDNYPLVLLAAYFIYNICYARGCNNFFAFLEVFLLGSQSVNASITVKHFMAAICD